MQHEMMIVVCGATGQQGSHVVESLLARGRFKVKAFSREPQSPKGRRLVESGVLVEQGDLGDVASLTRIFASAHGVFGVTQPWSSDYKRVDAAAEIEQGRNIVDACERAQVGHLVLSTVMTFDDRPTGIPHVDSKLEIERYLFSHAAVRYTLLRPASFMDNIGAGFFPVKEGRVRGFTDGDAKIPYISCHDIGEAVASAFESPDKWQGKAINLVADYASGEELCALLAELRSGRKFRYSAPPALLMRIFAPEFYKMRRSFEQAGRPPFPYQVGIDQAMTATRELISGPRNLERHLAAQGFAARTLTKS